MSTLILVFHPHLKDGSRVNARLLAELAAQGEDDIIVRDEYAEYPNFSVNADKEHELLEAADRVILQFPFYWYSSPALLKEWEDEVITAGWAYAGAHALKGKELKLVVTTGSDAAKYRKDGEYSHTMEELLKLPGVGRKTANLILGDVYHTPGVVVADTHCIRISGLLGLTDGTKDPGKVEQQLRAILPPEESNDFCHRLVLHGRAVCIARRPQCQSCVLRPWCDHFAKSGQTARGTEGREPA